MPQSFHEDVLVERSPLFESSRQVPSMRGGSEFKTLGVTDAPSNSNKQDDEFACKTDEKMRSMTIDAKTGGSGRPSPVPGQGRSITPYSRKTKLIKRETLLN